MVENLPAGADTRLRKQIRDLLAASHSVSVITRGGSENDPLRNRARLQLIEYPSPLEPRTPFGHIWEYLVSFLWATVMFLRLRMRERIDVLQVCQPPDIYFPLAWAAKALGARVVVDQRDLMPELFQARYPKAPHAVHSVLHWLERRTMRAADYVLVVNDFLRVRMLRAAATSSQVSVIYNGPLIERVDRSHRSGEWRRHRSLVCWIGKMGRQDRTGDLVEVIDAVVRKLGRTDCGFAILGDGECLDALRRDVTARGLEPWLTIPGWLPEPQVFGCLAASDVGIDTSMQEEVSPVKVMEYMAFGLPVVAYDLLETRRTLQEAGVLVAPSDVSMFAKALVTLLDDPEARARLGTRGRRRVECDLAWERQRATYLHAMGL